MVTRALSFMTDMIIFLFTYCFIFVSVLVLLFDRNTDYDRFITAFYSIMIVCAYLYFILPLFFKGKTLGKKIFKITLKSNKGMKNIVFFHIKYIALRLFPIVSVLLLFSTDILVLQILFGLFVIYPIFDLIYMSIFDEMFTDKILHLDVKIY